MSNQEAIALLRNLEDSLDSYCELNEEGKTAFRMAIEALSCSEFLNNSDTIYRQQAIDEITEYGFGDTIYMSVAELKRRIEQLPSAQPETAKRIVGKSREGMTLWYQCDRCNEPVDVQDNFCRGCGRRLVETEGGTE